MKMGPGPTFLHVINILLFRCEEDIIIVHPLEQEASRKMLL
jgi:hypothetical protein